MKTTYNDVIKEAKKIGLSLSKWKLGQYKALGIIKSNPEAIQNIVTAKFLLNIGLTLSQVVRVMKKHGHSSDIEMKYKEFAKNNVDASYDSIGFVYEQSLNSRFKTYILK